MKQFKLGGRLLKKILEWRLKREWSTTFRPRQYSVGFAMRADDLFIPKLEAAIAAAQREMELSLSVSIKRGMFGAGTGEPLTPEEEAYVARVEERMKWEEEHCSECGRPYDD